ncbi:xylulokinase [Longilinea arvoryzae]|uniref:Xylulose kinase n=1 Tax=Longilinea arvoryzae TaxID=360412 RepID=A0A0S7B8A6_9CHLR|nr:xylulokinase [Longilinea arvoryzae]GAP13575.1 xylulokinase [Longilinea arvoryzae]
MPYFLGIDVSTTATKALLIDSAGKVIAVHSTTYGFETPHPLWSEQDPALWWNGTQRSIRAVLDASKIDPSQIFGVGLTGQMHGLVLLDAAKNVLRPAILWNDQRTQAQCDKIHQRIGRERFIQITGNVALTGFTAPKILWVKENEPEIYARAAHVLLPKDYVRYKLTGEFAMDVADGAGTVLMDLQRRDWSTEVLSALDIPRDWVPPLYEGPQITGRLTPAAAEATGLLTGTPVMAGGGDQAAGAVGMGVVKPGVVGLTVGTSGVVFATTPAALVEPGGRLHAFCHAVPGMWHFMGVMLSAAGSLQWYRDTLAPGVGFDELVKEAESIPAGSEGLQFLPYLSGERTPHPDPFARGAFIGLTVRHGRGHLTRAVLEGVAYGLKDSFTLIQNAGLGEITQVRASGGGTKSRLWRQILASVLEAELVTVNTTEGAAYGAALLAGVGAGNWKDVDAACRAAIVITGKENPDGAQVDSYRKGYEIYRDLYPTLKSTFRKMGGS